MATESAPQRIIKSWLGLGIGVFCTLLSLVSWLNTKDISYGHARLHDLRHSTASEMINAGVDLYTVGGVLGHKSAISTKRYSHLATKTLQNAVGLVGKKNRTTAKIKAA